MLVWCSAKGFCTVVQHGIGHLTRAKRSNARLSQKLIRVIHTFSKCSTDLSCQIWVWYPKLSFLQVLEILRNPFPSCTSIKKLSAFPAGMAMFQCESNRKYLMHPLSKIVLDYHLQSSLNAHTCSVQCRYFTFIREWNLINKLKCLWWFTDDQLTHYLFSDFRVLENLPLYSFGWWHRYSYYWRRQWSTSALLNRGFAAVKMLRHSAW